MTNTKTLTTAGRTRITETVTRTAFSTVTVIRSERVLPDGSILTRRIRSF
jgi:hypothetical protein